MIFYHINTEKLKCPRCGAKMVRAKSVEGSGSTFHFRCSVLKCKTFLNTFIPLDNQRLIAEDSSERLGVFGGYGSGKTSIDYQCDEKHALITPNGETLIGADTLVQIENTVKKDLERDLPIEFVKHYSRQKNKFTLVNGHVFYYRPMASEGDLRSYNLTRAHLLEASEIKHESYVQIQSRVRNEAALIPETDELDNPIYEWDTKEKKYKKKIKYKWMQTVVESNPDSGWIRTDFLYRSGKIYIHDKNSDQKYEIPEGYALPIISSHIIPTSANYHLPADFEANLRAGKPEWWQARYLDGSFEYSEGLVYPNYVDRVIDDFPIPNNWQRIIGFDYGLNDNSHFVFAAIDWFGENKITRRPAIFFFDELVYKDMNIKGLADAYKRKIREVVPVGTLYRTPVMDAKSYAVRQRTGSLKTLGRLFFEYGCNFKPAQMDMSARVLHLNDFIQNFRVFFFRNGFKHATAEFLEHKFVPRTLEKKRADEGKPQDKNNHGVNATEFVTLEVSKNLRPDFDVDVNQMNTEDEIIGRLLKKKPHERKYQNTGMYISDYEMEDRDEFSNDEYEGFARFMD